MNEIKRFFVARREDFRQSDFALRDTLKEELGITALEDVRSLRRYDLLLDASADLEKICDLVLSEPRIDIVYAEIMPEEWSAKKIIAVEPLPGQYDQRADSCAQCIEVIGGGRPEVHTAMVYVLEGTLTDEDEEAIIHYLVNPVDSRLADLSKPERFEQSAAAPETVPDIEQVGSIH